MTQGVRIPDHIRNAILDAYEEGRTIRSIAAEFGCGISTVTQFAKDAGISRPASHPFEDLAYRGGWERDGLIWRPVA